MAEMIENPGAQELVQENQTAVEQPEAEGGGNKNKGDIRQETEYGYKTELDYMDSSIPDDDDDSTLKEQDISDDEDDDERDLLRKKKAPTKCKRCRYLTKKMNRNTYQPTRTTRREKTKREENKAWRLQKDTQANRTPPPNKQKTLPNVGKRQHEHQKPKKVTKTKHLQAIKAVLQRRHLKQTQMQTKKSKNSENKSTESKGHQRKKKWKIPD